MSKKSVIVLGSLAGAIIFGIVVTATTYFALQYVTETPVEASPVQAVPQEIATPPVAVNEETRTAISVLATEVPVVDEASSSMLQKPSTPEPSVQPVQPAVILARIVPDGWIDHQIIDSSVIFAYPPHWRIAEEDLNSVTFTPDGSQTILVVAAKDGSFLQIVADGSTEMLKRGVLTFTPEDVDVAFGEEGILAAPFRPAYLTALMHVDDNPVSMLTTYATDGGRILLILLMNNGQATISEEDFHTVTQLVQSVSFGQHIRIDDSAASQEGVSLVPEPTAVTNSINVDESVNLRQGPGTAYAVVGSLQPEERFRILARNQDGDWYQIRMAGGETAWVAESFVKNPPSITHVPVAKNIPPSVAAPALKPALGPSDTDTK